MNNFGDVGDSYAEGDDEVDWTHVEELQHEFELIRSMPPNSEERLLAAQELISRLQADDFAIKWPDPEES